MSFAALAWAGKCNPGSASRKLVLLALADRHNDEVHGAYPSIAWLVDFTSLNRKTVINCLGELEGFGFISDTGERRGTTKQIKFYRLHLEAVPKAEQFQKRNSSKKVNKQSQKRDTEPVRTSTPIELSHDNSLPAKNGNGPKEPSLKPEHVVEAWNDMAGRRGLPKVAKLTPERRRKVAARIRESSIDDFTEAIGAIERSAFLRGENDRGWRADFDFLIQPKSFTKLIEGSYG